VRPSILIPAALVAVGLAAQVPENLVERYNAGLAGVTQALKDLKYQEACAKADAMVPVKTPAFQGKDVPAILGSMEAGKGLLAILKLQANTQAVSGRWEKAQEIHLQRVGYAKALQKDLGEALEVQENSWKKIVVEG